MKSKATSAVKKPKQTHRKSAFRRYTNWRRINWWYAIGLLILCLLLMGSCSGSPSPVPKDSRHVTANQKFVFKIKTSTGGIIGGVLIEAKDVFAAISKLNKRYPGCEILEVKQKNGQVTPTIAIMSTCEENSRKKGSFQAAAASSCAN